MEQWPNFFIVGAIKAGTTSLYYYLEDIPGIYFSPIKEPRYFNSEVFTHLSRISDKSEYLKLFRKVKDQKAIGEASAAYLQDPMAAKLIHNFIPQAKIIILLRDPIGRAFSTYLMHKSKGVTKKSFHEIVSTDINKKYENSIEFKTYIIASLYFNQVKKYYDIFGPKQVKVWFFEDLVKNPESVVREVLDFLDIEYNISENLGKIFNEYGVARGKISELILGSKLVVRISNKIIPQSLALKIQKNIFLKSEKKPQILKEDKMALEHFYLEDMKNLQKLLQRKLPRNWIEDIS